MAADFIQMDLLAWGADPVVVADIGIQISDTEQPMDDQTEEFTDGITPDRLETIELPLSLKHKLKDRLSISLSCGDSGKWYCGWSAWCAAGQEGTGFFAYPKFSDAFDNKYQAFEQAMTKALGWLVSRQTKLSNINLIKDCLEKYLQGIDPQQYHRDSVCEEWRTCGYVAQCFDPDNDAGEDPVCFKEQLTNKGKQAAQVALAELCKACHASTFCAGCCSNCKEPCNAKQSCRWPSQGAK